MSSEQNRLGVISDGRSSPSNSVQGSIQSTLRTSAIDSRLELREKKRSFKHKMKDFFRRSNQSGDGKKVEAMNKKTADSNRNSELATAARRLFYINDRERNLYLPPAEPNYIRTTKYTIWSFLPLSLMFQFKRLPNFYFLIQAILNSIPIVSALHPISAYLPLAFVLMVSMVREGVEDYARYNSDKVTNRQQVRVVQDGQVLLIQAKDVRVGDLLLVEQDEMFPADLVLMASSDPDASCYIQTSSLDGEKALKTRKVPKHLDRVVPSGGLKFQPDEFICSGLCEIEAPHGNLYSFSGRFKISRKNYALEHEQMLLKGTFLRNTRWVVGLVVYTGKETRIMMNSQMVRDKQSDIEKMMNKFTAYVVTAMLVLTLVLAILGGFWHSSASQEYQVDDAASVDAAGQESEEVQPGQPVHFYIDFNYSSLIEGGFTFLRYFQLLSLFLPTSLFVSVEFLKIYIAHFMNNDWRMINLERCKGVQVKNMSIVEDLGMISYIFSDKTGTLTRNQMEFHSMCVGQETFGPLPNGNFDMRKFESCVQGARVYQPQLSLTMESDNQVCKLQLESTSDILTEFMTAMSLTHNCIQVEKNEKVVFQGQSPDEITLVEFAKKCGFEFVTGTDNWAVIKSHWLHFQHQQSNNTTYLGLGGAENDLSQIQNTNIQVTHNMITEQDLMDFDRSNLNIKHPRRAEEDLEQHYEVECRMDFTSDRKRMSILVRDFADDKYKLYIKGADSEIKKRLKPNAQNDDIVTSVDAFVAQASSEGLRTLLFAMKVLDEEEVHAFQVELEDIQNSIDRIEVRTEELYSRLERGLTLLGATALEDRLQENVPEVINDFHEANIKVWMLTGDQFNTAENIGRSCRLIKPDFEVYRIKSREQVEEFCSEEFIKKNDELIRNKKRRALIVEAPALISITERAELEVNFIRVSKTCEAVICCRVSPKQKAEVVRMIKQDDPSALTLAIGDGANDVSMINEAHVGIGIFGNEGLRAVQSSDYAIPEFQTLRRLILVHGRSRYISVSKFILYFFYKNAVMTLPQYFYSYFCGFSATSAFDDFYINLYNTFFTCLPPLSLGIVYWDVLPDLDEQILLKGSKEGDGLPKFNELLTKLYYVGQRRKQFNTKNFVLMQAQAAFDSIAIFFISFFSLQYSGGQIFDPFTGQTADHWSASVTCFTALVLVVHVNLLTRVHQMTWLHLLVLTLGSTFVYFLYMWFSNFIAYSETRFVVLKLHRTSTFYLAIACSLAYSFSVDFFIECYRVLIKQTPTDFLRMKVSQREPLNETTYTQFKQLVYREEKVAHLKKEQERSLTNLRHQEFLRLRQSSFEGSRPGSQSQAARPSVSREASRNNMENRKREVNVTALVEEQKHNFLGPAKTSKINGEDVQSQSVRIMPQSFVSTMTINNESPSPSPNLVQHSRILSSDKEVHQHFEMTSMKDFGVKDEQQIEVDSEIASELSSDIEKNDNAESEIQKTISNSMADKRNSGNQLAWHTIQKNPSSDLDSPHSLSVDNTWMSHRGSNSVKNKHLSQRRKHRLVTSNFKQAFVQIDESVQEEDEALSKKMINDSENNDEFDIDEARLAEAQEEGLSGQDEDDAVDDADGDDESELSIDRMTEQLDELSIKRHCQMRQEALFSHQKQGLSLHLQSQKKQHHNLASKVLTTPSERGLNRNGGVALQSSIDQAQQFIQENNFVRESNDSPVKSLQDLEAEVLSIGRTDLSQPTDRFKK